MDATPLSIERAKLTSSTNRVVYRLVKAIAMSIVIGFIAGWNVGFQLLILIILVDSMEVCFSESRKRCGFRFSLIFLLCVLVFSSLVFVLNYIFFHSDKETALINTLLGLVIGSSSMNIVASVKKPNETI
jgi:hypothetical protein